MKRLQLYLFGILVLIGDIFYIRWVLNAYGQTDIVTVVGVSVLVAGLSLGIFMLVGYHLSAMRKGNISIQFPDRAYDQGDILTGTVCLQTHVELEARSFRIALSAQKTTRSGDDMHTSTVWEREIDLLSADKIFIGAKEFNFSFEIPHQADESPQTLTFDLSSLIPRPKTSDTVIGRMASLAGTKWYLTATLDVPGANLLEQRVVRVNDGSVFS